MAGRLTPGFARVEHVRPGSRRLKPAGSIPAPHQLEPATGLERGDTRLYRFPAPGKPRPVLVLTRASALGYLSRVTVAPITSTIREVPSEVVLGTDDGMKQPCAVNLHNVVTVSRDALGRRVTRLPQDRMREACSALAFALGCGG